MRRRDFTKLALAGAAGTVAAPAVVRAQTTFNWKMTSFYGPNAAFYSTGPGSATDLGKRIDEMSGGRLKIQVYGAGELIPAARGLRRRASSGTVEMNHANSYFWTGKTFAGAVLHRRALRPQLPGHQRLALRRRRPRAVERGLRAASAWCALPCGNTGVQMTGWFKKEIKSVDDLKGLKMRIPGLAGQGLRQRWAST